MGTRSLTTIIDDGQPLVTFYRQMDGYPTGHGKDLLDKLKGAQLVNGYCSPQNNPKYFNGMPDLAAWIIGAMKFHVDRGNVISREKEDDYRWKNGVLQTIGSIYIMPATIEMDHGAEFTYHISEKNNRLHLKVTGGKVLYNGPLDKFNPKKAEKLNTGDEE